MRVRELMFSVYLRIAKLLWGTKITRMPLVGKVAKFLFLRLRPAEIDLIEVEGNRMYVNRGDIDVRLAHGASLFRDPHDKLLVEWFKEEVKTGMTVIDLGAHVGYHTLLAAKLVGKKGKVFAFEPAPDTYALLTKNIALNGYQNVSPIQKVVSNKSGQVRLFLNDYNTGRNSIYDHYDQKEKSVIIDSVTLDGFFEDKDLQVDFIKMDIEGAEMAALSGMDNLIRKNKNLKLISEFNPEFLRGAGSSPEEFLNKLAEYGFKIYDVNQEKQSIELANVASLLRADNVGRTINLLCIRAK